MSPKEWAMEVRRLAIHDVLTRAAQIVGRVETAVVQMDNVDEEFRYERAMRPVLAALTEMNATVSEMLEMIGRIAEAANERGPDPIPGRHEGGVRMPPPQNRFRIRREE